MSFGLFLLCMGYGIVFYTVRSIFLSSNFVAEITCSVVSTCKVFEKVLLTCIFVNTF